MKLAASEALSRAAETGFDARDAYQSVKTLSVLVFVTTLIVLESARANAAMLAAISPGPWRIVAAVEVTVAAGSFAWLLATERRPSTATALGLCALLLVPLVPIFAVAARMLHDIDRPWEALVGPKLAMISVALVVPRYFWLGVACVAAFAIEAVTLHVVFLREAVHALPRGEPVISLFYGAAGLALLFMREKRRQLTVRYLRVESEATMLRRAESQLRALCGRLDEPLRVLGREIARLRPIALPNDEAFLRMNRALERLRELALRLSRIEEHKGAGVETERSRTAPSQTRHPGARTPSAREPAIALDASAASAALSGAERRFHAHDAHVSATIMAAVAASGGLAAVLSGAGATIGHARLLWTLQFVLGLAALIALFRTRRRPTEGRALFLALLQFIPALFVRAYVQTQWAHTSGPYEPFLGHKVAMAILPIVVPRRFWLGIGLELVLLLETMWLYHSLHLTDAKDRIPFVEPWWTILYAALGMALMFMREQRRVASVRLLREHMEVSILTRRTALSMAILDQIASPLQSLTFSLTVLKARHADPLLADAIDDAVRSMAATVVESTELDPRVLGLGTESFDAVEALSRSRA